MSTTIKLSCVLLATLLLMTCLSGCGTKKYDDAKDEMLKFLNKYEDEMIEYANELMKKESGTWDKFKGKYKTNYNLDSDGKKSVSFYIGQNGEGENGQLWGLKYYPDKPMYTPDKGKYNIVDQRQFSTGNYVFVYEKLNDQWIFQYNDYEGKLDLEELE